MWANLSLVGQFFWVANNKRKGFKIDYVHVLYGNAK